MCVFNLKDLKLAESKETVLFSQSVQGSEINFFMQAQSGDWKVFFFSRQMEKSGHQKVVRKICAS